MPEPERECPTCGGTGTSVLVGSAIDGDIGGECPDCDDTGFKPETPTPEPESVEGLLARIRELDAAATKGPWEAEDCTGDWADGKYAWWLMGPDTGDDGQLTEGDAKFLAESRTLLPRAAEVIERMLFWLKEDHYWPEDRHIFTCEACDFLALLAGKEKS